MKKTTSQILRDYGLTVVIAVTVALGLRTFLIEAFKVSNNAMNPGLLAGDLIFVEKWQYKLTREYIPARGDVIVYSNPSASRIQLNLIRRVMGLPGDRITIKNGLVQIKTPAAQPQTDLKKPECSNEQDPDAIICKEWSSSQKFHSVALVQPLLKDLHSLVVEPGHVFVISDQRTDVFSSTGNRFDRVPLHAIIGQAKWIWLSFGQSESWNPLRVDRMFKGIE